MMRDERRAMAARLAAKSGVDVSGFIALCDTLPFTTVSERLLDTFYLRLVMLSEETKLRKRLV